ncbi:MAG TPA: DUF4325 domain-containing protein [Bacteroidia bacterium]|jgi:hypothetical protein|nr:DUF4325 domain-containing protein [Bacteroidia bacterium]
MNKEILIVSEIVSGTSTNAEGYPLFLAMDKIIENGNIVVLSLKNCNPLSSSFLNSSIGSLIEKHGYSEMKGRLVLTNYTHIMADYISRYISRFKKLSCTLPREGN